MVSDNSNSSIQKNYTELPFQEFLNIHYSEIPSDWIRIQKHVEEAMTIENERSYNYFLKNFGLKYFDYEAMFQFYEELKLKHYPFDIDILKFISFLRGLDYFKRIGDPNLNDWLNAKNLNKPFDNTNENGYKGNSLLSLTNYQFGMNAVRVRLLSTLKW